MNALREMFTDWPDPRECTIKSGRSRTYATPQGEFGSVTTFLKVLGTSTDALVKWSANEERKAVLEACGEVYAAATDENPPEFVAAVEARIGPARSHQKMLSKAADIGSEIHEMIQWTLRSQLGEDAGPRPALQDQALWAFMSWEDWWKNSGLVPVRVEQPIWHAGIGYAGTIDLIAMGPLGLEVLDWKSGKGIYESYHLQVAAYRHAAEQWAPITRCRIVRVPKTIGDPDFDVAEHGHLYGGRRMDQHEMMAAFEACVLLWNALMKPVPTGKEKR